MTGTVLGSSTSSKTYTLSSNYDMVVVFSSGGGEGSCSCTCDVSGTTDYYSIDQNGASGSEQSLTKIRILLKPATGVSISCSGRWATANKAVGYKFS